MGLCSEGCLFGACVCCDGAVSIGDVLCFESGAGASPAVVLQDYDLLFDGNIDG